MIYRFGSFELDIGQHLLRRDGTVVPVEPQVFDLLTLLVRNAGNLVDREQIIATVWHGRIVSEAAISSRINAVRRAIGDSGRAQETLQTVPRRGFRFVAPVEALEDVERRTVVAAASPHRDDRLPVRHAVSRDGTGIAFETNGSGPGLLRAGHFLTHLALDWESPVWRPLLERLGRSFTVTRYDQRGTGLSDPPPVTLSLERLVDDLEAVADAACLDRFPIFAASQGVPVALAFAVRRPERVSAMVLYGGFAQGRRMRECPGEAETADAILEIIRRGWGRSGGAFATAFSAMYMPDATHEQLQHMTELQLASATPDYAVALREAVDNFDVTDRLGEVKAPVLVLHVAEDAVHPIAQSRMIAARVPGARFCALPGRNHVPLPQQPAWEEMFERMLGFLDAC